MTELEKKQLFPEQMIGQSFPCHATQTASFFRKEFDSTEIEGNLEKGTDKLSIKINGDDTINFLTTAAVEGGSIEGDKSNIIRNDEFILIAQDVWQNNIVSTLTISKETGLGIWQETTASGLPMDYKVPYGFMIYLQCYIPERK